MSSKQIWLEIDGNNADLASLVEACTWRIDPIRSKILNVDENIQEIRIVNAEKVSLSQEINVRLTDLREVDINRANEVVKEIVHAEIMLWIPNEVIKNNPDIMHIEIGRIEDEKFTVENISDLIEEMQKNKDEIINESGKRMIEKSIKNTFAMAVVPRLDKINISQAEVLSRMAKRTDVDEVKVDILGLNNKLDILLKRSEP